MCEGGSREVPIPASGYTVDYLKAVIHSAKLYIRPLQTDLSVEQCSSGSEVCYTGSQAFSYLAYNHYMLTCKLTHNRSWASRRPLIS